MKGGKTSTYEREYTERIANKKMRMWKMFVRYEEW